MTEHPPAEALAPGDGPLLLFTVAGRRYGVELARTREILRYRRPTPLPGTPPFIEGVISVRGAVVPVVDLRRRLDLEGGSAANHQRLVIVTTRSDAAALRIEQILGVLRPAAAMAASPGAPFYRGVLEGPEPTTVLDLDAVLAFHGAR
jgi:purine-binding chemotaxis protein CheW